MPNFPPRNYVTPLSPMAIVREERGSRHFALVRWGFIPSWVKELKPGKPLINARAETILEKPSFRNAIRRRRCLIPADGFFEWVGDVPGKKLPQFIHRADDGLFAFAGIWEHWLAPDGSEIETAAIITTEPNTIVAEIHDRMPAVIEPRDFELWLDHSYEDAKAAHVLLKPAPNEDFVYEPTIIARNSPPPKPKPQMSLF